MTRKASFLIEQRQRIRSVEHFVRNCFALREEHRDNKFLYRGQAERKPLMPSAGREHSFAGSRLQRFTVDQERALLHRFRRRAYPILGRLVPAIEALFIARHHRLPTRLLDWTANALYALYFASRAHEESDGVVWVLRQRDEIKSFGLNPVDLLKKQEEELFAEDIAPRVKIVFPLFNSARVVAQDGTFTFHTEPSKSLEEYSGFKFFSDDLDIKALYSFVIPKAKKATIVRELSGLGITHRVVYPDLDGIAQSLWETEVLYKGKRKSSRSDVM